MPDKKIIGLERNVFFTGLVSFFMDFSSEMIYPLVPIFLSSVLGVNKSIIGLIEGIAESTASLLKVFSGWFSDRIGKRKIFMIAGYGISTLSRPIIALSALWGHVLVFRFIDRFGKGIRGAPRDAIIAESTHPKDLGRSFGFHRGMDTLGAVAGPAVAFLLLSVFTGNYRLVFWLSMIPGMIAVMVIVFFIKEQKHKSTEVTSPFPASQLLSFPAKFDWRFKAFVAIATLFAIGNSSDVFLILKATDTGIKETQIPILYLSFNFIYALTSVPAGILSDRIGRKRIILAGFILFGFIYWGFATASEQKHIWGLFLLYGVFMGLTEGIQKAYLGTIIPDKFRATGYGIFNTFVGLAILPASVIAGLLWDKYGSHATFYYGTITAFLSAFLFILFIITARRKGQK
ncbi:MAG: MFS transporter [Candidatus Schekmanbacteria bacterium GWA2_38_11]|uniref:MFS transporter n=1 Tax=Candidatus Schekmanbacteria bacterium GWA2_38_11 TaxID=1817876 RepID=A0A1F7R9H5_9BACT|nr:MAG: MFS transporter [Candidatus Schekmanbacteria bacterium GWA2_38_11]